MKYYSLIFLFCILILNACSYRTANKEKAMDDSETSLSEQKVIVYQIFTRLFGNTNNNNIKHGTSQQNGVGKFNDITDNAILSLKELGITHLWYTGIIEHAVVADFTEYGIQLDDPDVVKGRAGSPYAIKDYYDVNPDLAVNVPNRMQEFEDLIARTHKHDLNVIIDFIPNHVARGYHSDQTPSGKSTLGAIDNTGLAFSPNNNFYYIPNQKFQVPEGYEPIPGEEHPLKNGQFDEDPAKATGNDVFTATPSVNDWFETIKINYGVDYQNDRQKHFDPIPDTWYKMKDILLFWASKGVDGFRCDMAEMTPVEFWNWTVQEVINEYPEIIFIAEIYNPDEYVNYIKTGGFDFLYDKVQLYDTLRNIIAGSGSTDHLPGIMNYFHNDTGIDEHMLRFLENHDEQRIASEFFAGDPHKALPAMLISATISKGPVMLYFGQEVGEPGKGDAGFNGEDGRTTIFDYWGVPEHQKWLNDGKFDGALLSEEQKNLRNTYSQILNLSKNDEALVKGDFYDLHQYNLGHSDGYRNNKIYTFFRAYEKRKLLVIANFGQSNAEPFHIVIPENFWPENLEGLPKDLLTGKEIPVTWHPDKWLLTFDEGPPPLLVLHLSQ